MPHNTSLAKPAKQPVSVFLFDISRTIRSVSGKFWSVEPSVEHGTIIRAAIGKVNCRIIIPRPGGKVGVVPEEKNHQSHIVESMAVFKEWLASLTNH